MFSRILGRPPAVALFLGLVLVPAMVSRGRAEQKGNETVMKPEFNSTSQERQKLLTGVRQPQGKDDEKIMDITARWFVYRVTWSGPKGSITEMAKLHDDLEKQLLYPMLSPNTKGNRPFIDQFGRHLAKYFKEVLTLDFADADNRMPVVNAALMLPPVARLKQEEIGDLLAELLKDKERNDAVRVYAAKALREFFPARLVTDDDDPKDTKIKTKLKQDKERLQALVDFIDRKGPLPKDENELEAIRYVRREAVMSLAQIGVPALSALKKDGAVEGPAAYELLRVLVKKKGAAYEPLPSVSERVEAALGLCQLKNADAAGYDPSVAVYAVGLSFHDFAAEFSKDYTNISSRKGDPKNFPKDSKVPTLPFRILSDRYQQGIKDLVAGAKGTPAQANAKKLEQALIPMAQSIKSYNSVTGSDLTAFRKTVETLAPKTGQLYKLKGPQIDPASLNEAAAAAAEDN
jgi:hypothetical protein